MRGDTPVTSRLLKPALIDARSAHELSLRRRKWRKGKITPKLFFHGMNLSELPQHIPVTLTLKPVWPPISLPGCLG
jgi:hypothetical protein